MPERGSGIYCSRLAKGFQLC
uniref:Uncharacterized protein n=1 Tax=Arundo donax TaxID=35708 RepID=A0A0A9AAP6_ARUDO